MQIHCPTKIEMQLIFGLIPRKKDSVRLNASVTEKHVSPVLTPYTVSHCGPAAFPFKIPTAKHFK
ncbi:hypothetical protein CDL15_Pgr000262 [Punica granatum]|uniref:Uncharacterized protein n=1 Tax=Punica granatum TaxID=22663 RepID=A0A218Y2N5_PUNGR|nr:hypothetical protein CDL15_Pgr000262 [Punica granatum]